MWWNSVWLIEWLQKKVLWKQEIKTIIVFWSQILGHWSRALYSTTKINNETWRQIKNETLKNILLNWKYKSIQFDVGKFQHNWIFFFFDFLLKKKTKSKVLIWKWPEHQISIKLNWCQNNIIYFFFWFSEIKV